MSIQKKWYRIDYSDKPAIKSPGICEANIAAFKRLFFAMEVMFNL